MLSSKNTQASRKLEAGPARAVRAMPRLGCLKYRISTGTGLAQPTWAVIISTRPRGSMCRMGLRVRRPSSLAVGSPRA